MKQQEKEKKRNDNNKRKLREEDDEEVVNPKRHHGCTSTNDSIETSSQGDSSDSARSYVLENMMTHKSICSNEATSPQQPDSPVKACHLGLGLLGVDPSTLIDPWGYGFYDFSKWIPRPGFSGRGILGVGPSGAGISGSGPSGAGISRTGPLGSGISGAYPSGAGPLGAGILDADPLGAGPSGAGILEADPRTKSEVWIQYCEATSTTSPPEFFHSSSQEESDTDRGRGNRDDAMNMDEMLMDE